MRDDNEGQSENYSSRIEKGVVGLTLKEVRLVVLVQMLVRSFGQVRLWIILARER